MKNSIKKRFGLTIAVIIAGIILAISIPLIVLSARNMDKNLQQQISKLIEFSEETLPTALWQYNYDYAHDFIGSLFLYEDVILVSLTVNDQELIKKVRPEFTSYSQSQLHSSDDFVAREVQIHYRDIPVGTISLIFSRHRIKNQIRNNFLLFSGIILLLTAGVLTTNIKLLNWYIFDPLLNLEKSVKQISYGDLSVDIHADREDEIGHLAKSFAAMMANLKKITASRDELDHEISQRKITEKKYKNLFDNAQIGMYQSTIDDGKIVESNLRMAQIFGYESPEQCIANYVAHDHYVNPSERKEVVRLLKEEGHVTNYQTQIKLHNGDIIWIQFSGKVTAEGTLFEGVATDITEQKIAEAKVQASLTEKEVLLKEIHHRVKNNLQMIQSLLSLQQNEIDDPEQKKPLIDSNNRIKSMSLIHETLYQSDDIGKLNVQNYISEIIKYIKKIYHNPSVSLGFSIQVDDIDMNIDNCISCGLIINELVSNSLKYAFKDRSQGEISLTLKQQDSDHAEMTISDNGKGFEVLEDIDQYKSLGLRIVNIIVKGQLKGNIAINNDNGVSCVIDFPLQEPG